MCAKLRRVERKNLNPAVAQMNVRHKVDKAWIWVMIV